MLRNLRFELRIDRETDIAIIMDASMSMGGEKLALLALATAVVALCVPTERLSLMGFDSKIRWVKRFNEELTVRSIIERVLELPAGGFTNLELALKETLQVLSKSNKANANVILISDGKYTEGRDPSSLAQGFRHLNVMKIGKDQAGRELLQELVLKGHGKFFEARKMTDLPKAVYSAMRVLLR